MPEKDRPDEVGVPVSDGLPARPGDPHQAPDDPDAEPVEDPAKSSAEPGDPDAEPDGPDAEPDGPDAEPGESSADPDDPDEVSGEFDELVRRNDELAARLDEVSAELGTRYVRRRLVAPFLLVVLGVLAPWGAVDGAVFYNLVEFLQLDGYGRAELVLVTTAVALVWLRAMWPRQLTRVICLVTAGLLVVGALVGSSAIDSARLVVTEATPLDPGASVHFDSVPVGPLVVIAGALLLVARTWRRVPGV